MLEPEQIYAKIVESGDIWADLDAAATILEEVKKTVFARIFNEQPQNMSISAREHNAAADKDYEEHLGKMVEARRKANRARVRFDGSKLLCDLRRSEESTRRAAMRGA